MAWSFVEEFSKKMGKRIEGISKQSLKVLQGHPWPGNVRELRNVVERAMIRTQGKTLHIEAPGRARGGIPSDGMSLAEVEKEYIVAVLKRTGWRVRGKGGAAEILDLPPTTLESRMNKLKIHRPSLQ